MARVQTMIVPSPGDSVEFVVIIDECSPSEVTHLIEATQKSLISTIFGARGVLAYAGTLDVTY